MLSIVLLLAGTVDADDNERWRQVDEELILPDPYLDRFWPEFTPPRISAPLDLPKSDPLYGERIETDAERAERALLKADRETEAEFRKDQWDDEAEDDDMLADEEYNDPLEW